MNFDFSDDAKALREPVRTVLADLASPDRTRKAQAAGAPFDAALWRAIVDLGWLGVAVGEVHGGAGLGHEGLCVLAEELGASLAMAPALSTLAVIELIAEAGSATQKADWIPRLLAGAVGAVAFMEGAGEPDAAHVRTAWRDGHLHGHKACVAYGESADVIVVAARTNDAVGLHLCAAPSERTSAQTLDVLRPHATLILDGAVGEPLPGAQSWPQVERLLDRLAIITAFEQLGGAHACLDGAVAYAKERHAFGRPIGGFQAIKHKLADLFIAVELARSNAIFGAWALAHRREETEAAACARLSASEAYHRAAHEGLHVHGGTGFVWDASWHLHVRRSRMLAAALGAPRHWRRRLVTQGTVLGL